MITAAEFPADICYKKHNIFFLCSKRFFDGVFFFAVDAFKKRHPPAPEL